MERMSQTKQRSEIPDEFTWNLNDLYKDTIQWKQAKQELLLMINTFSSLTKKMHKSASHLQKILDLYSETNKLYMKLYAYAMMLSDQDTRNAEALSLKQESAQLGPQIKAATAFIEPEILALNEKKVKKFFKANSNLHQYDQFIKDIRRRMQHTLRENEEKIIAEAGLMAETAQENYTILSNADLPFPTITIDDGTEIYLDHTAYGLHRASQIREDRRLVFEQFFGTLDKFNRTFGSQLYGEIKKNLFYKNVRRYDSCLSCALDRDNIPTSVYHALIQNVNQQLPALHRYLQLRQKLLAIDQLYYYDIYPSLVKEVDLSYSYLEAQQIIKSSLTRLGSQYTTIIDTALQDRWIDVYPNIGKKSGAYMEGITYDNHPYILLNYSGKYNDVSTLTHELGHAVHSYLSNKNQTYINAHYPIFLAEVASTVNEALLIDHEIQHIDDQQVKLSLLGNYLEGFRSTLFRQTQFAEFELKIHELSEKGAALTCDQFSEIYLDILKKYYGHNQNIMAIDDLYAVEWCYIPHFYYNFYVYQYSTSFCASQAIVEKILASESGIIDKYISFLSGGCSEYPLPMLKKLGIDMTGNEPFTLTMKRMHRIMDAIENIIS
jgi:oligoendopeptidase F